MNRLRRTLSAVVAGVAALALAACAHAQVQWGYSFPTSPGGVAQAAYPGCVVVGSPTGGCQGAGSINATSIKVNGTSIVSNCSPGGACDVGSLNVTSTTPPAAQGIYSSNGSNVAFYAIGNPQFEVVNNTLRSVTSHGAAIGKAAASATNPTLNPDRNDTSTGVGAQAPGNISMIVVGVEKGRWTANGLTINGAAAGNFTSVTTAGACLQAQTIATGAMVDTGLPCNVLPGPTTVALLATISPLVAGYMTMVSDAMACTFHSTPIGGGAQFCPVIYTGSAWIAF